MTQFVEFRETLRGVVRAADAQLPVGNERATCALAAEAVLLGADDDSLRGCVADGLVIAVDVGSETAEGGLSGIVRSGALQLEGALPMTVSRGEFELFPRAPADARRLRYRLWLRDADGADWFLRGTKLVTNEVRGGRVRRAWAETTTLYVVLAPDPDGNHVTNGPVYAGVLRVGIGDFARQLASVHGEPGPAGGIHAVRRLASFFRSVLAEVYLHDRAEAGFAPGIGAAFDESWPDRTAS